MIGLINLVFRIMLLMLYTIVITTLVAAATSQYPWPEEFLSQHAAIMQKLIFILIIKFFRYLQVFARPAMFQAMEFVLKLLRS